MSETLANSIGQAGRRSGAGEVERELRRTHSVPRFALLRVRAFPVLTRWHSCLSHCPTPAGALARAQGVRRLRAAARVPLLVGSLGNPGGTLSISSYAPSQCGILTGKVKLEIAIKHQQIRAIQPA